MNNAITTMNFSTQRITKWFNSCVHTYTDALTSIRRFLPEFERRCFALGESDYPKTALNKRLDMIVRKPIGDDHDYVPVGVVSKEYKLIPHTEVFDCAVQAMSAAIISLSDITVEMTITEYGERMSLSMYLPPKYDFIEPDGNRISLRLVLLNSVEGSTRFHAFVGWYRLVCSNGLIIGVAKSELKARHVGDMNPSMVYDALEQGLLDSENDRVTFREWQKIPINEKKLEQWVTKPLRNSWGFKAAARAYHIATTGHDAKVSPPYTGRTPLKANIKSLGRVPGCPQRASNVFDISQILSWIATQRRDIQEQFAWQQQIPELMQEYLI